MSRLPRFIKDDPDELADYIAGIGQGFVAFDGWSTAGKSPLARSMTTRLGCTDVDADKFLPFLTDEDFEERRKRPYPEKLRIDDLRRAIEAGEGLVLLHGVCARRVVDRLKMSAAAFVWVQRATLSCLDRMCKDFFECAPSPGLPLDVHSPGQ